VPYYSYQFADDAPLDVAVNSRGVVFSHSVGNDSLMLAIYDDNGDGRADYDEVVVEGLSIDNNLFLHGLTVDQRGNVYVIEDASSSFDGSDGNGGIARIDAFPDPNLDGTLRDGSVFSIADFDDHALSGLAFGWPTQGRKLIRKTFRTMGPGGEPSDTPTVEVPTVDLPTTPGILLLNLPSSVDEADSEEEKRPCEESKKQEQPAEGRSKKKQPQICTDNADKKEISDKFE